MDRQELKLLAEKLIIRLGRWQGENQRLWLTERRVDDYTVYTACLSSLPLALSFDEFRQCLPTREQARIARFHRSEDRQRSLVGLYLFEHAVRNAGQTWQWESFVRSATGRPMLQPTGEYDCNVSHSGDFVVCAIGPRSVGIDIEQVREIDVTEFRRFFPPDIYQHILTADMSVSEFFRWWTRIESVLKADGRGLCDDLTALRFCDCAREILLDNRRWRCCDLDIAPGYVCCLAMAY